MSKDLGIILRTFRTKCGLTQLQVADALHLDRSTYAYYERGTTEPDLKGLRKLSVVFNVDPTLLLPDDEGRFSLRVSDVTAQDPSENAETENTETTAKQKPAIILPAEVEQRMFELPKEEKALLAFFRVLSASDKDRVMEYVMSVFDESDK